MATKEELEEFVFFIDRADPDEFTKIFGSVGDHLIAKVNHYNRDAFQFYTSLDLENRRKLAAHVTKHGKIRRGMNR